VLPELVLEPAGEQAQVLAPELVRASQGPGEMERVGKEPGNCRNLSAK